jgi:hypothetical protein
MPLNGPSSYTLFKLTCNLCFCECHKRFQHLGSLRAYSRVSEFLNVWTLNRTTHTISECLKFVWQVLAIRWHYKDHPHMLNLKWLAICASASAIKGFNFWARCMHTAEFINFWMSGLWTDEPHTPFFNVWFFFIHTQLLLVTIIHLTGSPLHTHRHSMTTNRKKLLRNRYSGWSFIRKIEWLQNINRVAIRQPWSSFLSSLNIFW